MNENTNTNKDLAELNLRRLFFACLQRWWLIVISAVVVGIASFIFSDLCITPKYEATATIYVNNIRREEQINYLSDANLSAAQHLVNTYIKLLESDYVLEDVAAHLGDEPRSYSAGQLRGIVSATAVEETELFNVHATHEDPEEATRIVNMLAARSPILLEKLVEGSSSRLVDKAQVPTSPSSPSLTRNTLLGAVIAGALAVLLICVVDILDVRVKEETDITGISEFPILGRIPDFDEISSSTSHYGYSYGRYGYGYGYGYGYTSRQSTSGSKPDGSGASQKSNGKGGKV